MLNCDSPSRSAPDEAKPAGTPPPAPACWFALRTRPRYEFAVRDALRLASTPEFLPVFVSESRWSDRTVSTQRPLFPGYLFARLGAGDLTQARQTRGVLEILSLDGKPAPIPDAEIANLQRLAATPGAVAPCAYVAGETVTVARGPFAGITGVVSRVKQGASEAVLTIPIEILGRAVRVAIAAEDVEPEPATS